MTAAQVATCGYALPLASDVICDSGNKNGDDSNGKDESGSDGSSGDDNEIVNNVNSEYDDSSDDPSLGGSWADVLRRHAPPAPEGRQALYEQYI